MLAPSPPGGGVLLNDAWPFDVELAIPVAELYDVLGTPRFACALVAIVLLMLPVLVRLTEGPPANTDAEKAIASAPIASAI